MHIPGCLTTETELLEFDRALEEALAPSADYDVSQWLYVPNTYRAGQHPQKRGAGGVPQRV